MVKRAEMFGSRYKVLAIFYLFTLNFGNLAFSESTFVPVESETKEFDDEIPKPAPRPPLDAAANSRCEETHRNSALMFIDLQDYFVTRDRHTPLRDNGEKLNAFYKQVLKAIEIAKNRKMPIILVLYDDSGPALPRVLEAPKSYDGARIVHKSTDGVFDSNNTYRRELAQVTTIFSIPIDMTTVKFSNLRDVRGLV